MTVCNGQDPRIPLPVVAQALRELIYTDSLIPHSVGESQRSWCVAGAPRPTYVEVDQRFGTRYITNEAEMLTILALAINEGCQENLYLDLDLCWLIDTLEFTNCNKVEFVLEKLAAIKVKMIFGNIDYIFHLGRMTRTFNNIPCFKIGPELMSACQHIFLNCATFGYDRLSQPLARRIVRAFARKDLLLDTPYTADQLCHTLRLYTSAFPATAYGIAPIPMYQVRERLFRVQSELIQAGFISEIRERKVGGKAALSFIPGTEPLPEWN